MSENEEHGSVGEAEREAITPPNLEEASPDNKEKMAESKDENSENKKEVVRRKPKPKFIS